MPIEDTTESIKNKHESAKPGANRTRTTGCMGEARTRAPNRPRHATGEARPVGGQEARPSPGGNFCTAAKFKKTIIIGN